VKEDKEIVALITNFYKDLFHSHAGSRYDELLEKVHPKVSSDMNAALQREVSDEEIKSALDCMGALKAPGMDGMPVLFYKHFWDIVGADVTRGVKNLLGDGAMAEGWNDTIMVVLILKVPNLDRLKDLRPISLCNVVYKIASNTTRIRAKGPAQRYQLLLQPVLMPRISTGCKSNWYLWPAAI